MCARGKQVKRFQGYALTWLILTGTQWAHGGWRRAVGAGLVLALLLVLPWYLGSRARDRPPSLLERGVAGGWVWLRRLVAWLLAFLLIGGAWHEAAHHPLAASGLALGGVWLIWVGAVGMGRSSGFRDDLPVHGERKQRYGWWW